MASSLVQFGTEGTEKIRTVQTFDRLRLSLPSYLGMCVSRLNQENGIPFSMKLDPEPDPSVHVLNYTNRTAGEYGISDMTLEEINAEVTEARE